MSRLSSNSSCMRRVTAATSHCHPYRLLTLLIFLSLFQVPAFASKNREHHSKKASLKKHSSAALTASSTVTLVDTFNTTLYIAGHSEVNCAAAGNCLIAALYILLTSSGLPSAQAYNCGEVSDGFIITVSYNLSENSQAFYGAITSSALSAFYISQAFSCGGLPCGSTLSIEEIQTSKSYLAACAPIFGSVPVVSVQTGLCCRPPPLPPGTHVLPSPPPMISPNVFSPLKPLTYSPPPSLVIVPSSFPKSPNKKAPPAKFKKSPPPRKGVLLSPPSPPPGTTVNLVKYNIQVTINARTPWGTNITNFGVWPVAQTICPAIYGVISAAVSSLGLVPASVLVGSYNAYGCALVTPLPTPSDVVRVVLKLFFAVNPSQWSYLVTSTLYTQAFVMESLLPCGSTVDYQQYPAGNSTHTQLSYLSQPSWLGPLEAGIVCSTAVPDVSPAPPSEYYGYS
ncbi:hypothetical protein CEUSTIGMA_g6944.t1 [Chlamydomonas eustigma]|uniref:Pherophorin domain-containing protein n=1 Tax=Chlamydomonas eustigma TaxID=1157962 RepID=A0A250X8V1_9CHLO|nr:hypothetical protein CEUSTIGMA_g6944.t1 [Chlamydomonas eustigma]|eukprot:GAX79503.1 hypothetical protein CEUSTIGMA_g6944.t1 [Chlamydomonas eustigma]